MFGDRIHAALFGGLLLPLPAVGEADMHLPALLPVGSAGRDHRGRGVVHRTDGGRHHLRKDVVDEIEHGGAAAEIAVEGERAPRLRQPREFFGEEGGAAPAEAVDGLLHVADHEHVPAGNEGEDLLLRGVHVLIFVHEYVGIPARDLFAHLRLAQKGEAVMFEVGKIQRARAALEGGKLLVIDEQQLRDALCRLPRSIKGGTFLLFAAVAGELFYQPVHRLLERGVLRVEGEGGGISRLVDLPRVRLSRQFRGFRRGNGGKQPVRAEHGVRERGALSEELFMPFAEQAAGEEGLRLFGKRGAALFQLLRRFERGGEQLSAHARKALLPVQRGDALQKGARIRLDDDGLIRFEQYVLEIVEPAAVGERRAQPREQRRLLRQQPVEGGVYGAAAQLVRLRLVEDAEVAGRVRLVKIAADDGGAEGVHGADVRGGDLAELRAQAGADGGVLFGIEAGDEGGAQPFLHLGRREVRERDGEHGRHFRLLRKDERDDLFHHHEGLAAARRRGNEHLAGGVYRRLLFGCGFAHAHLSPLLFCTTETISSAVTFFSLRAPAERSYPHTAP